VELRPQGAVLVSEPPKSNTLGNEPANLKRKPIMNFIKNFLREEDGVTAIEYGLIAALVGVAIIVSVTAIGTQLSAVFKVVSDKLLAVATAAS
jgi:pilus assembly protein Flp/PilA